MKLLKMIGSALLVAGLAACGGGGGSPGTTPGTGGGSTTTPTTPTTPLPTESASVGLSIVKAGAVVSSVSVGGGYLARATVKDAAGAAVANKLVTFDLGGSSIATIDPTTALTNASGVAEVAIAPASLTSKGAASLTAKADVNRVAVSASIDFSVSAASLSLSTIRVGSANLPSGGNTPVEVTALVGGVATTVPVNVTYAASCGRINSSNEAGGVSVTTNGSGVASAVYSAVGADGTLCSGLVTLTASSAGALPQTISLTVAAPTANAVTFVSALPAQIFVAGSGAVDQAIVRFKVLSSVGTPLANVPVNFSILTNPGGVSIGANSATTDASGEAKVAVFSGTIPGPIKLRAALDSDSSVFAESQNLTVASGPPSQRFMSLSVETFNIEGWDIDGTPTRLTVRIADRQGNAVEDGTVVNFTAEGGQVASSCATTRANNISSCSVNFISQNNRPAGGRVSVLAYTEGTKDYVDVNSNNRFDSGIDTLIQIGDAYRDDNENGTFDAASGEFRIPRGFSGGVCVNAGAPYPSIASTCDDKLATTVRQQTTILFASSSPAVTSAINRADITVPDGTGTKIISIPVAVNLVIGSEFHPLLPMPAGTKVAATVVDSNSTDGASCSVSFGPTGTPIPNIAPTNSPLADLATRHSVSLKDCRAGDQLYIDVTAPSGLKTTFPVSL